jgi:hypothetical protein
MTRVVSMNTVPDDSCGCIKGVLSSPLLSTGTVGGSCKNDGAAEGDPAKVGGRGGIVRAEAGGAEADPSSCFDDMLYLSGYCICYFRLFML